MEVKFLKVKNNKAVFIDNGETLERVLRKVGGNTVFHYDRKEYLVNDSKTNAKFLRLTKYHKDMNGCSQDTGASNMVVSTKQSFGPMQSEFHINARFGFLESFAKMVLSDITCSLLVCGEGGLGKSHSIFNAITNHGLVEGIDYVVVKGYATPKALYATLFENKDSLIVFDDCDSVLKDPTALNILKGALDSYDVRTISWLSKGFFDDGLPASFEFTGRVIFISNMTLGKIDGAVRSRTMAVDLSMTLQDKIDRMKTILPEILPEYTMAVKNKALNFLEIHKNEATELNMRTLQKIIKLVSFSKTNNLKWEDAAKYLLTNV